MTLQNLKISNIASIHQADIDFDKAPLSQEAIFLITGKTGSGKSTILNCICLALYNQVPILKIAENAKNEDRDKMTAKDPRQLMNKRAKECSITLSFVGNDNKHYIARWSVQRAHKKAHGAIQDTKWSLEVKESGVTITKKNDIITAIANAVGLTYDQFTRTTLLAQGEFAAFLHADKDKKSELLEKLTGTEIFAEIGKKINDNYKDVNGQCEVLKKLIDNAGLLSDDEIESKHQQESELKEHLAKLKAGAEDIKKKSQWLSQLLDLQRKLQEKTYAHQQAQGRLASEEFAQKVKAVDLWARTSKIRMLMQQRQEAMASLEKLRNDILQAIRHAQQSLASISSHREALAAKADEGKRSEARLLDILNDAVRKYEAQIAVVKEKEAGAKDDDLDAINAALAQARTDLKTTGEAYDAVVKLAERQSALDECAKRLNDLSEEYAKVEKGLQQAAMQLVAAKEAKDKAEGFYEGQLVLNKSIESLRQSFSQTNTCPLCGTEGVHMHSEHTLNEHLAQALEQKNQAIDGYNQWFKEQTRLKTLIGSLDKQITDSRRQLEACQNQYDIALDVAKQKSPNYGKEGALDEYKGLKEKAELAVAQVQQQLREASGRQTALIEARRALDPLNKAKEIAKESYDKQCEATRQMAEKAASLKEFVEQASLGVKNVATALQGSLGFDPSQPGAKGVPSGQLLADDKIAQMRSEIEGLKTETDSLKGAITTIQGNISKLEIEIRQERAQNGISDSDLQQLGMLSQTIVEQYNSTINHAKDLVNSTQAEAKTLTEQIDDHTKQKPDLDEGVDLDNLKAQLAEAEQLQETKAKELTSIQLELRVNENNKKLQEQNMQKLEELRPTLNNWKLLDDSFGGSDGKKFRNIAQSYVLRILLAKANFYLKRLHSNFTLDCDEGTLTINILDSDEDTVRHAGLLSGGESFIVSLSLALGLSAISKDALGVDTMFIDEGFGTLDQETLDKVLEVLQKLHTTSGRRIGIISHVERLKDTFPTQILVKDNQAKATVAF